MDELVAALDRLPAPETPSDPVPAAVRLVTGTGLDRANSHDPNPPGPGADHVVEIAPEAPRPRKRSAFMAAAISHYRQTDED